MGVQGQAMCYLYVKTNKPKPTFQTAQVLLQADVPNLYSGKFYNIQVPVFLFRDPCQIDKLEIIITVSAPPTVPPKNQDAIRHCFKSASKLDSFPVNHSRSLSIFPGSPCYELRIPLWKVQGAKK